MGLFDSHAHYDDPRFAGDLDQVVEHISSQSEICPCGVEYVVNIGCDVPTSRLCLELAEKYPLFYAAVGIHPQDAATFNEESIPALKEMLRHPKAVAIGEIGLDYKYENSPRDLQKAVFRRLMDLARETGYPVCIHDRDAHGDVFDIIREFPDVKGVMHSFSGSPEMARQYVKMGWFISFSGTVTFKNAAVVPEAAKVVPLDRLLVETDAPYLAPVPYRGKRNKSSFAYATAARLAELHGLTTDEMVEITRQNALNFFQM
ncbi:MAG: TatD family hydrolase [Clostridia bacterium]|nr:TatD family hydrolase [Clostridia bacterium]